MSRWRREPNVTRPLFHFCVWILGEGAVYRVQGLLELNTMAAFYRRASSLFINYLTGDDFEDEITIPSPHMLYAYVHVTVYTH